MTEGRRGSYHLMVSDDRPVASVCVCSTLLLVSCYCFKNKFINVFLLFFFCFCLLVFVCLLCFYCLFIDVVVMLFPPALFRRMYRMNWSSWSPSL